MIIMTKTLEVKVFSIGSVGKAAPIGEAAILTGSSRGALGATCEKKNLWEKNLWEKKPVRKKTCEADWKNNSDGKVRDIQSWECVLTEKFSANVLVKNPKWMAVNG